MTAAAKARVSPAFKVKLNLDNMSPHLRRGYRRFHIRRMTIAQGLIAGGIHPTQAYVVAGDMVTAEEADDMVRGGAAPVDVICWVGSHSRFDWAYKNLTTEQILPRLPELWSGADPDDTKPEYLDLWRAAFAANGNCMVIDELPLDPKRCSPDLRVYRGQVGPTIGISWTYDRKVAVKFARNGGGRVQVAGGVVLAATIRPAQVLAHIDGRGESEVIIDPSSLRSLSVVYAVRAA